MLLWTNFTFLWVIAIFMAFTTWSASGTTSTNLAYCRYNIATTKMSPTYWFNMAWMYTPLTIADKTLSDMPMWNWRRSCWTIMLMWTILTTLVWRHVCIPRNCTGSWNRTAASPTTHNACYAAAVLDDVYVRWHGRIWNPRQYCHLSCEFDNIIINFHPFIK